MEGFDPIDTPPQGTRTPVASSSPTFTDPMGTTPLPSTVLDVRPTNPKMGGVVQLSKDSWSAWTGGKPNASWTALADTEPRNYTSPNQLRSPSIASAQKGYNFRRTGQNPPFKQSDDFVIFKDKLWDHFRDTGMDSIAYLPDPAENSRMISIVKWHARFTTKTAQASMEQQLQRYDSYDRLNDTAATTYLLTSISTSVLTRVKDRMDEDDPFPLVWLHFMKTIQSTSVQRFEDLKLAIKQRSPTQFAGENLESLAARFKKDADELMLAGQYDHNLTLAMINIFLTAGGDGNETFRYPLRATHSKLEDALLDIGFMEKSEASSFMTKLKLSYRDICDQARDLYRKQFDRGEWPPARHLKDSKAPPSAFANSATVSKRKEANVLIQNNRSSATTPNQGACHNCGKTGHWSKNCPDRHKGSKGNKTGMKWKTTPPLPGAPTTRTEGKHTFKWCAKCNRWSTTHSTETHRGKTNSNERFTRPTPEASYANTTLVPDPAVWTTESFNDVTIKDLVFLIVKTPMSMALLITLLPFIIWLYSPLSFGITRISSLHWETGYCDDAFSNSTDNYIDRQRTAV